MRKRWRLILCGMLAVVIVAVVVWPRSPDQFAELRAFHPHIKLRGTSWEFIFREASPELFRALNIPPPRDPEFKGGYISYVTLPNGLKGRYYYDSKNLVLTNTHPSSHELEWLWVKHHLGIGDVEVVIPPPPTVTTSVGSRTK